MPREKYAPLRLWLTDAARAGRQTVEFTFTELDRLVDGLPESARSLRTWWGNSSHSQALAWRDAGWHVEMVNLTAGRVRFARGKVGGTYADRGRRAADAPDLTRARQVLFPKLTEHVDLRVRIDWHDAGQVTLDQAGKPKCATLPEVPGIYRFTFGSRPGSPRPRVYVGESDNLRRRLAGNYRNPGPSQQTSMRINALLREDLANGGQVALAIATKAESEIDGLWVELDLTRKATRLLAESAAVVRAQLDGFADVINLG